MDNFKQATKEKIRFSTSRGNLSVEQLWDLPLTELDELAVQLEKDYNESGKKSYLVKRSVKDKMTKLKFDVALEVLSTKVQENEAALEAKENKEHNQKILRIIADKQDETLKGKSIKELEKELR